MARVNLEESFFSEGRLDKFAFLFKVHKMHAVGVLAFFWHDSQEMQRVSGTAEELADWARIFDPDQAVLFIKALLAAKYITAQEDGTFLIHGNDTQIAWRDERRAAGHRGGVQSGITRLNNKQLCLQNEQKNVDNSSSASAQLQHSLSSAQAQLKQNEANSMQGNTMQESPCGAVEVSTTTGASTLEIGNKPKPPSPRDLADIWNSECVGAMIRVLEIKSGTRRWNSAKARLDQLPDLEAWRELIKRARESPFVRGEVVGRDNQPWRASLDWLIRPETATRIREGVYDEKKVAPRPLGTVAPGRADLNARMEALELKHQ